MDDRNARCVPAAHHVQEAAAQRCRRFHARYGMTMLITLFEVLFRNGSRSGVRIVAVVLSTAVAGCTVGPDFETPGPPSVTRYTSRGETMVPGPDATKVAPAQAIALGGRVAADWWTLFRSSKLDLLVKQAIAGSYTLESVKAKLEQAQEAVTVAASALYPQIGLNANATEEKQSAAAFGLTPNVAPLPSSFNLFQVGPTASYTPDLFKRTAGSSSRPRWPNIRATSSTQPIWP